MSSNYAYPILEYGPNVGRVDILTDHGKSRGK